jgi:hypothetical protein
MSVTTQAIERAATQDTHLLFPCAQPEMDGSRVLGVLGGAPDHPRGAYLNQYPGPVKSAAITQPAKPTQVMRFAVPRQEKACCTSTA